MSSLSLLGLCLLSLTRVAAGLLSTDNLTMFAVRGDRVTLPCGVPSVTSCSSINWNMGGEFGSVTEVVKAGRVTAPNSHRHALLKDCSLEIAPLVLDDAHLYTCDSGTHNSSVFLQILELMASAPPAEGMMELQCFLNIFMGHISCNSDRGIRIKWSTEDDTPLNGSRFRLDNPSDCFSKLIIDNKLTDHHRKWKCHLTQNDMVKATISYTTTVKDGLEEVFAVVGESVSLSCGNTSCLDIGESVKWAVCEKPLTDDVSPENDQTKAFHVNKDSSLVIGKLSAVHAGDYQCSESTGQPRVLNKVRLHTLDVTAESGGDNLTLTCALTCAEECEKDFTLTWSGSNQHGWQGKLSSVNNTLIKKLFLTVGSAGSDEITCSVLREGALMATKKWRSVYPQQTLAWLGLLLGLLLCAAAGGLYMYMKRKRNKDAANARSNIGLTHVYDVITDVNNEEQQQQRQLKREAAVTNDSFYDLLQAVN